MCVTCVRLYMQICSVSRSVVRPLQDNQPFFCTLHASFTIEVRPLLGLQNVLLPIPVPNPETDRSIGYPLGSRPPIPDISRIWRFRVPSVSETSLPRSSGIPGQHNAETLIYSVCELKPIHNESRSKSPLRSPTPIVNVPEHPPRERWPLWRNVLSLLNSDCIYLFPGKKKGSRGRFCGTRLNFHGSKM